MLLVLPPSETKRDGGAEGSALDLSALSFPELTRHRRATLSSLRSLSQNIAAASTALGLGPTQKDEVLRNRALRSSPILPAIERYTGVLYDGLEAESLTLEERRFANEHVVIHSALFGLLRAGDPIPAYRLSHDSRLPELSLRSHWKPAVSPVLADYPGLVLDLRSESYAQLGPAPAATYIRVVSEGAAGRKVALSHCNKKAKGQFSRAVIASQIDHNSIESLLRWAQEQGIRLEPGAPGELDLVV